MQHIRGKGESLFAKNGENQTWGNNKLCQKGKITMSAKRGNHSMSKTREITLNTRMYIWLHKPRSGF